MCILKVGSIISMPDSNAPDPCLLTRVRTGSGLNGLAKKVLK